MHSVLCVCAILLLHSSFFFFNYTATTEIYTLSLHDALPISVDRGREDAFRSGLDRNADAAVHPDRKSTRLNSSHVAISYAVFCLKKKKKIIFGAIQLHILKTYNTTHLHNDTTIKPSIHCSPL